MKGGLEKFKVLENSLFLFWLFLFFFNLIERGPLLYSSILGKWSLGFTVIAGQLYVMGIQPTMLCKTVLGVAEIPGSF